MEKAHVAEIIGVGTELLLGNTANTDAKDISEMLSALGINVYYHTVVGDNPERLRNIVNIAKQRADIIITTGGLGPTYDDLTKQVLAESFGLKLYFDETEAELITSFFTRRLRGAKMTENNLQQAWLPEGCTVFRNEWGTAPGCAFYEEGTYVLMMPGPPRECRAMFQNCAVPYLKALSDSEILSHSIRIFGEGESAVEDKLRDMMNSLTNPTLAPYAKEGEVMLRVTAKAQTGEEAEEMIAPILDAVQECLGDVIYGIDVDSLEQKIFELLTERGMTLVTAESITGGMLSKRLTDIPGSSSIFLGGLVTYSDESKKRLLDIPAEFIEEHGVVSEAVALKMAENAKKILGADFGIGITGYAGPGVGEKGDVGFVFTALATDEGNFVRELHLGMGRERIRTMAANNGLDMLRRYLTGIDVIRNS